MYNKQDSAVQFSFVCESVGAGIYIENIDGIYRIFHSLLEKLKKRSR